MVDLFPVIQKHLDVFLEWTASFETEGVAMDTFDAAAVGWVNPDATAAVVIEDETGFADFTDISKFAW